MASITVSPEHGYVLAVIALTGIVAQWHTIIVGGARRESKVPYPNAYASHEEAEKDISKYKFNCVQRAHSNYIENLAVVLPLMIVSGPQYPVVTAGLGGVWVVGRILYTLGYRASIHGDGGKGRYRGLFYSIAQVGLIVTAGMSVWSVCCRK